jgi:hypothetical protein
MLSYIFFVLLLLPNKWYQSLELKQQRVKDEIIWSLDQRAEDGFYYIVAGHPVGQCNDSTQKFEIVIGRT